MSTWLSFFINLHHYTGITGQITRKYRFVRKMRFAYGQIDKNGYFVRKFE